MRKVNTRIILVCFVALCSLACHFYTNVNAHALQNQATSPVGVYDAATEEENWEENAPSKTVLPDVQLLKKIVETGRRLIPAN